MFEWKDLYSVNIEAIDRQHKRLFELGEEIFKIVKFKSQEDDAYDKLAAVIYELKEYTKYHFDYEEALLKEYQFEDFEQHKKEHDDFIQKVSSITEMQIDLDQTAFAFDMLDYILSWISNHIVGSDKEYTSLLNRNDIF